MVWFGVLICINLQTSFMHPPFGFALFYLRGIAPKQVLTKDIYLGAIPWLCLQLLLQLEHGGLLLHHCGSLCGGDLRGSGLCSGGLRGGGLRGGGLRGGSVRVQSIDGRWIVSPRCRHVGIADRSLCRVLCTRGEIGTHINKQSLPFRPGHVQHSEVRMM
jgi:hypothetical protein